MNAVEIEEEVSKLAEGPFAAAEFTFTFLRAFGNKETTIKGLRSGSTNKSDVGGGVLQRSNIHLAVCASGEVGATLAALRGSPKTAAAKAKFILATDGETIEAEDLGSDDALACEYRDLPRHFGFFLPLAGISTVRQIKDNPIDVRATGRLNKLYVQLLQDNPDWATEAKRPELNRFMARLIFCFFAEDTNIFLSALFSRSVEQFSDATSTHEVLAQLFMAMSTPLDKRAVAGVRPYADGFPYVNGGLFSDAGDVPRFSRIARTYLLRAAELNWREINPDIFGSMIQAVADDAERGELGMHYTSVPNILKVLDPLFLDDLRAQMEAAGDSVRKLRALRRRMASIRVFDPACGSGNFLVIAYLKMREIEAEIVRRTGDAPRSMITLTNFYGIEIKSFAAEIARLALLIAEFQADVRYIGQEEARSLVLPLHDSPPDSFETVVVATFKASRKYTGLEPKTRKSYDAALHNVCSYRLKDGRRFGALPVRSVTPGAADRLYERLVNRPDGSQRQRAAMLEMRVCQRAWNVAYRSKHNELPAANPFAKMDLAYTPKSTYPLSYDELGRIVRAADIAGEPSMGTAAMIAFFWLQREEDILTRLSWGHYRPSDRPEIVRVFHHKTRELVPIPLSDIDGTPLWPELMQRLDSMERQGTLIVMRRDRQQKLHLPWKPDYFRHRFHEIRALAEVPPEAKFMGLRHGGNTESADAGLTDAQIRALSGHKTSAMTALYAKQTMKQRRIGARKRLDQRTKGGPLSE